MVNATEAASLGPLFESVKVFVTRLPTNTVGGVEIEEAAKSAI